MPQLPQFRDVIIEAQARQSLIRYLYLNAQNPFGVMFGQAIKHSLHIHKFADCRAKWTDPEPDPSTAKTGISQNWRGHWGIRRDDLMRTSPHRKADGSPFLTANWDEGELVIRAYAASGDDLRSLPVYVLS